MTNVNSLMGINCARKNGIAISRFADRLSTGKQVNRGSDDPSGLAIMVRMRAQTGGYRTANQNAQDCIGFLQVRDAAMAEVGEMIMRIRDLALRAANEATLTADDRSKLQNEASSLVAEINRINAETSFNKMHVFGPGFSTVPGGTSGLSHAGQVMTSIDLKALADANGGVVTILGAWYDGAAAFPDFNLISPDGTEAFGYLYDTFGGLPDTTEAYVGGGGAQTVNNGDADVFGFGNMDSAASIVYSGWGGYAGAGGWDEESFVVTNPAAGAWTIVIDNEQPVEKKYGLFFNAPSVAPVEKDRGQIGPNNNEDTQVVKLGVFEVGSTALGVSSALSTVSLASSSISSLDGAIENLSNRRAETGVKINTLEHIVNDNMIEIINLEASRSRIEDADVAIEITGMTRTQIITQANVNALSEANSNPSSIMTLLGGALDMSAGR